MGTRFSTDQIQGIIVHDDKIVFDAVNDAESTYTEAGAFYAPPQPGDANNGNLIVHASCDGDTPQEITIVGGGTSGSAQFLYRNQTAGTWTGQRPFTNPSALEYIQALQIDPTDYTNWQPAIISNPDYSITGSWQAAIAYIDYDGAYYNLYTQNYLNSTWSSRIGIRIDTPHELNPGPQFVRGPGDSIYLLNWRVTEDTGTVTMQLDIRTSTDGFLTHSFVKRNALEIVFDITQYDEIVGYDVVNTPGGYLLALYFQLAATPADNRVCFYASSDGGAIWTALQNEISEGLDSECVTARLSGSLGLWCDNDGKITFAVRAGDAITKIYEKTALYDEFTLSINESPIASAHDMSASGTALNDGRNLYEITHPSIYRGGVDFAGYGLAGRTELAFNLDETNTDYFLNLNDTTEYHYRSCALENGVITVGTYYDGTNYHLVNIRSGLGETYASPPPSGDTVIYSGFTSPAAHGWTLGAGGWGPNQGNLVNGNGYTFDIDGTASYYDKDDATPAGTGIVVEFAVKIVSGTGKICSVYQTTLDNRIYVQFVDATTTSIKIQGVSTSYTLTVDMTLSGQNTNCFRVVIPQPNANDDAGMVYVFHKYRYETAWDLIFSELQSTGTYATAENFIRIGELGTAQTCEFVLYQMDYFPTDVPQEPTEFDAEENVPYDPELSQNPLTIATPSGVSYLGDGLKLYAKGGLAYYADTYSINTDSRYPLRNIFPINEPSPSRVWRSAANTAQTITIDLGLEGCYPQSGTFGFILKSNCKNVKLALSATPADSSGSLYDSTASQGPRLYTNTQGRLYRGGLYPMDTASQYSHFIRSGELKDGWADIDSDLRNIKSNTGGYWIGDGAKVQRCVIGLDGIDLTESSSAENVTIVTGNLCVLIPGFVPSDTARYLTLYIPAHDTPDGYFEVQQFVAGWFHAFGFAPDASTVRAEEYNAQVFADAYGRRRFRQNGPKRRTYELSWGQGFPNRGLYQGTQQEAAGEPWRPAALEDQTPSFINLDSTTSTDSLAEGTFTDVYSTLEIAAAGQLPCVLLTDVPAGGTAALIEYNLPSRFVYGRLASTQTREERFGGRSDWIDDDVRVATVRFEEEV